MPIRKIRLYNNYITSLTKKKIVSFGFTSLGLIMETRQICNSVKGIYKTNLDDI